MNENELARDLCEIENKIETRQLRDAFQDLKRSMLMTPGGVGAISSGASTNNVPLSLHVTCRCIQRSSDEQQQCQCNGSCG
ncbi:WSSV088 [White spot syndrome virus]|uniref:WSSV088 n=1 Tax=White spot syndrome virus TaxID=342409 RepID=A0A2I6SBL6_9VIRU|nr:WSSV088 [White spot syndrome virus]